MILYPNKAVSLLVIWPLTAILYVQSAAYHPAQVRPVSLPFQTPQVLNGLHDNRSFLVRVRDGIVRILWDVPYDSPLVIATGNPPISKSSPPSSLLARYGGDVVLRFKIQSSAEAAALNEAITVLFLDVWEYTSEWVDIRMPKDVVCQLLSSLSLKFQCN